MATRLDGDGLRAPDATLPETTDPLTPLMFLQRTASVFPDKEAVVYGDRRLTWRAFADLVGRYAAALERDGVRPGDRVAVLLPNVPEQLASAYAVPLVGAVLVAMNTRLAAAEVAYILRHSGARVLLVDPEFVTQVDLSLAPPDLRVVNVPDRETGIIEPALSGPTFEEWTEGLEPLPIENTVPDERNLISLNYTSGTTGQPKGVMYTHRGVTLNSLGEIGTLRLGPDTVYLWTLPMFHCNGWCMVWAVTGAAGVHVCMRAPRPSEVVRLVQQERVTDFSCAPTVLRMLAADPGATQHRFDPPVHACVGGAPPSPADLLTMEHMGVSVTHLYGLTETHGPHVVAEMQPAWRSLDIEERAALVAARACPTSMPSTCASPTPRRSRMSLPTATRSAR